MYMDCIRRILKLLWSGARQSRKSEKASKGERLMNKEKTYQILNRDAIKYFAMFAMLLNHIANIFLTPGTFLAELFFDIGYFTAITMCYFLVEGYQHTSSKKKYGIRLFIFALLSQFPFSFAFAHGGGLNMIYTLFICFMILVVREKVTNPVWKNILVLFLVFATGVGDWAFFAAVFVIMFGVAGTDTKKFWRTYLVGMIGFGLLQFLDYSSRSSSVKALLCAGGACLGMLASGLTLRYLYNGKRAVHGRNISKWFFYIFYPAHLLILGVIERII